MFNKNLGMRLEYEQMKYDFGDDVSDKMRMWSIGVQYNL
jgi:hypothetical protein